MLRKILLGLGFVLLLATGASAASFDCKKAATAFEQAVCETPDLSKLDETLAQAYATAVGGLSKPAAETMRVGQRQWLDYVQRACSKDGDIPEVYSDDDRSCMSSEFQTRLRALEGSRMSNGLRFYLEQSYEVVPTTSTEDWSRPSTRSFISPLIDSSDSVANGFNDFAGAEIAQLKADALGGETQDETDISIDVKVTDAREQRIALSITQYWFGHGAAHGNYALTHAHYLPAQDRALVSTDIFQADGWEQRVGELVYAALRAQLGENLMGEDLEAGMPDLVADVSRWDFSDAGLVMQFQPYEVAAYAYGAPTVTIPWTELEPELAPDAMSIATY